MGKTNSKPLGLTVGYGTSAAATGGSIALMILGGPIGLVAGGIGLGAGLAGGANTIKQNVEDKKTFDFGEFGIGARISIVAGNL